MRHHVQHSHFCLFCHVYMCACMYACITCVGAGAYSYESERLMCLPGLVFALCVKTKSLTLNPDLDDLADLLASLTQKPPASSSWTLGCQQGQNSLPALAWAPENASQVLTLAWWAPYTLSHFHSPSFQSWTETCAGVVSGSQCFSFCNYYLI